MKKCLGIVLALFLMAVLSAPVIGATLSVSGKYVGEIWYDGGRIASKNPFTWCDLHDWPCYGERVDLLDMSTLYLNLDFSAGEALSAHVPLRVYGASGYLGGDPEDRWLIADQNPDDNYKFVYKGTPLTLSLTDAEEGDYFFSSFGDALGLVWTIPSTDDYDYATFKAAGQPFGIGFTSYFIATDPTVVAEEDPTYPRYALARATYGLSSGHTIGAIYAASEDADGDMIANFEADATGPLFINEGATLTTALALSKTQTAGVWSTPVNAFELNLAGISAGAITLSGNVRAVDPDFVGVLPDEDDSDIVNFAGKRQIQGEAVTNVNLAGQATKLTVGDDYRVNYDGTIGDTSTNKVYGSAEFKPSDPTTVTVGASYKDWLTGDATLGDDYEKNVYGKVKYAPADSLELNAGGQWMGAEEADVEGTGFKLDGSATVKPVAGVQITGSVDYQFGEYDWIDETGIQATDQTRLDGEAYGEAKQTFVTAGVKQVDTVLAGLARGVFLSSPDVQTTYVGYAEANIAISDLFSDKIAVLSGNSTETDYVGHYGTIVHNKFTYTLSSNSTFDLGYTYRDTAGTWDAAYTVTLDSATIKVGYGASGLEDACEEDFDEERPWAWLCTADIDPNPDFYKVIVTIPF